MNRQPSGSAHPAELLPWFRARHGLTVAVLVVLYLGVFVLRISMGTATDMSNMLYTLPIALAGLAYGWRIGLLAGVVAVLLVAAWVVIDHVDLSVLGWLTRVLPMLLLGVLLGDASDRLRRANDRWRTLEAASQRHRDAVEINDTLVQGMVAAKWSLESGRVEAGVRTLSETISMGHAMVSKLMHDADMGLNGHRPPTQPGSAEPGRAEEAAPGDEVRAVSPARTSGHSVSSTEK